MWYLNRNNKQEGPLDEQAIAEGAANGTISRDMLVWRDGMAEWLPLHRTDLGRLFPQQGTPPPIPKSMPSVAGERLMDAAGDTWRAFRIMALDPVGKLSSAFESLGQNRALGVGLIFGAVFALCVLFDIYQIVPEFVRPHGISGFLKLFLGTLVPFISLAGASAVSRITFRGHGQLGHDCFIAGTALIPLGLVSLLTGILGVANIEVIVVLSLFALCLTILLLFTGMSRICAVSERAATIAVPLMLIATLWFSKIIYTTIFKGYFE
jgi:hypothetical protein